MAYKCANNAATTLAAQLLIDGETLTVATGDGDLFPVIVSPDYTYLTIEDGSNDPEVVKVTARNSGADAMTIVHAQDGTTARQWEVGDIVELRLTKGLLEGAFNQTAASTSFAPAGTVAATDVQAAIEEVSADVAASTAAATAALAAAVSTLNSSLAGKQALHALLTALSAQTTAANKIQAYSGANTCTLLDFKDEDNMASDSATGVPSQQSVKAYVDTAVATKNIATQVAPGTSGNVLTSNGSAWVSGSGSGLGIGQSWQNMLASRAVNTVYQNTTGVPIEVKIKPNTNTVLATLLCGSTSTPNITVDSAYPLTNSTDGRLDIAVFSAIIPAGHYYKLVSTDAPTLWAELR